MHDIDWTTPHLADPRLVPRGETPDGLEPFGEEPALVDEDMALVLKGDNVHLAIEGNATELLALLDTCTQLIKNHNAPTPAAPTLTTGKANR